MKKIIYLTYSFVFSFFFSTVQAQVVKQDKNTRSSIIQSTAANSDARFGSRMADNILLLHAEGSDTAMDVQTLVQTAGGFASVDLFDAGTGNGQNNTPVLADLMPYDAVLVWSDFSWVDGVGVGDALAEYIEAGGAVVDMTFAHLDNSSGFGTDILGAFDVNYELFSGNNGLFQIFTNSLGQVLDPAHPTMAGVATINNIEFTLNGMVSPSATVIAQSVSGDPLVIVEENVGPANVRRAALMMWPASTNVNFNGLNPTEDGYALIANTLNWVAGATQLPANDDCTGAVPLTVGVVYEDNPVDGTLIGATDSGFI